MEIRITYEFSSWLKSIPDVKVRTRIQTRIDRIADGNFGDVRPVGIGVSELRINIGPGYRVYIAKTGANEVTILCGGDKKSQARDISRAHWMVKNLEE